MATQPYTAGQPRRRIADYTAEGALMVLVLALVFAGAFVGWVVGHYTSLGSSTKTVTASAGGGTGTGPTAAAITPAPAFSTSELAADPTDNWITNGGSLSNQRYSPLSEITTANISGVKGVWMTHLNSGLAAKYSAESQPLEYNGVIYVPTGQDDVFAVDAETGKILWKHPGNLNQTITTVCCGWESRGVALGDGKARRPGRRPCCPGSRATRSRTRRSTSTAW
jgi:alcohol dehydrogenase (cytochrome c)